MIKLGAGRWSVWADSLIRDVDPAFRLAVAVLAQAVQDAGRGIALGPRSPAWYDAVSALQFLLVDVWDEDRSPWHAAAKHIPRRKFMDMIAAQTGQAAFKRCLAQVQREQEEVT